MHKSVGAIIKNDKNEILMLDRVNFPFGWACPAGHIDDNETPEAALKREVKEETRLTVKDYKLLFHEYIGWNECKSRVKGHDWYLYEARVSDDKFQMGVEAKEMRWVDPKDINKLNLEEIWQHWFKKLKLI